MNHLLRREDTDGPEPLSAAVIAALAEYKGVDPMELDPPLYEAIDPDALDTLDARRGNDTGSAVTYLAFSYDGRTVEVTGDGAVRISETSRP